MSFSPTVWKQHHLEWGRQTYVMGIVNVTPDSFSGDGLQQSSLTEERIIALAVEQARRFVTEGATFLDIGGESTRPQAAPVSIADELRRVVPVIQAVRAAIPPEIIISVDTYKSEVAAQALEAGADLVNDIWGLRYDPVMAQVIQAHQVPVILMANMRGFHRREIMSDIVRFLSRSIDIALEAGIAWEHIIIDPGIGFGLTLEEDLMVQRRLRELRVLGRPLLLGTSRKSHIGRVLGGLPASERVEGTAATVALGIVQGVDIVRVHDVHEMIRIAKMSDAIVRERVVSQ